MLLNRKAWENNVKRSIFTEQKDIFEPIQNSGYYHVSFCIGKFSLVFNSKLSMSPLYMPPFLNTNENYKRQVTDQNMEISNIYNTHVCLYLTLSFFIVS